MSLDQNTKMTELLIIGVKKFKNDYDKWFSNVERFMRFPASAQIPMAPPPRDSFYILKDNLSEIIEVEYLLTMLRDNFTKTERAYVDLLTDVENFLKFRNVNPNEKDFMKSIDKIFGTRHMGKNGYGGSSAKIDFELTRLLLTLEYVFSILKLKDIYPKNISEFSA